jgi:hypothetical protein
MAAARTVLVRMVAMDRVLVLGHVVLLPLLQCDSPACAIAFSTRVTTCSSARL